MKETKFKQTLVQTKEGSRHCEEHSDVAIQGGFKMTEVGLIPNDWGVKKIGELCSITTGSQNTQDHKEDGKYPFFVRSQEVERIDKYIIDTEGVVTAGDGVGTGKIFHYVNGKFGLHQRCYLMYEFDRNISAKYFYWIFSVNFYDRVHSMTAKSSVDSVRREMIADMPIALPPIKEQQRIANALSDVDTLISNLEKLIAKKKNIKQGAMQQLLTGKKRLPGFAPDERTGSRPTDERRKECHSERSAKREVEESSGYKMTELGLIPSDWKVKPIKELGLFLGGGTPSTKNESFWKGNIPWISSADLNDDDIEHISMTRFITQEAVNFSATQICPQGTILIIARVGVGKLALSQQKVCTSQDFCNLIPSKENDSKFLAYALLPVMKRMSNESQGTSIKGVAVDEIKKVQIIVPSSKAEQTAIANVLSDMDTEISALETKLAKYRQLKTGMMQQLLTGKIRLL